MAKASVAKKRFTDAFLKSRQATGERYAITDATGLMLRVGSTGKRTFSHVFRFPPKKPDNKVYRVSLGAYHLDAHDGITLAQANRKIAENRELISAGTHPAAPREVIKRTTVQELADEFYDKRIAPRRVRPEAVRYLLDKDVLPQIGYLFVDDVLPRDIVKQVLDPIVERGADTHVKRVLDIVKQLFAWAVSRGELGPQADPAFHLKKDDYGARYKPRQRKLDDDEIAALWRALDYETSRRSEPMRLGLKLLLLTGVRGGELRGARWTDVDFDEALWVIPRTKTSHLEHEDAKPHNVPLSPLALDVMRAMQACAEGAELVMPSPFHPDKPYDERAIAHAVMRIRGQIFTDAELAKPENARTPVRPWRPHDLRRTVRSGLARLGVTPVVAEKVLGHKLGRIEQTYDVYDYLDERREALERWGQHVAVVTGQAPANVVALESAS